MSCHALRIIIIIIRSSINILTPSDTQAHSLFTSMTVAGKCVMKSIQEVQEFTRGTAHIMQAKRGSHDSKCEISF